MNADGMLISSVLALFFLCVEIISIACSRAVRTKKERAPHVPEKKEDEMEGLTPLDFLLSPFTTLGVLLACCASLYLNG